MKKSILPLTLFFAFFLFSTSCSSTRNVKKNNKYSELHGIWQYCVNNPNNIVSFDNFKPICYTTFKIIDEHGKFTNIISNSTKTNITVYGTYKVTDPLTYTENIRVSYTNPAASETANPMGYELINDKFLILSYMVGNQQVRELWVRVEHGNPLH